jgi:hypothetical protein
MSKIGPGRTFRELQESGIRTREGKGHPQLPGVTADAWRQRREDYERNRELNRRIGEAMLELKGSVGGKPKFVIGWRLYPNLDNKEYWDNRLLDHVCSCSCGGACIIGPDPGEGSPGVAPPRSRGRRQPRR